MNYIYKISKNKKSSILAFGIVIIVCILITIGCLSESICLNTAKTKAVINLGDKFIETLDYELNEEDLNKIMDRLLYGDKYIIYLRQDEYQYDLNGNCYYGFKNSVKCDIFDFSVDTIVGGIYDGDSIVVEFYSDERYKMLFIDTIKGRFLFYHKDYDVRNSSAILFSDCLYYPYSPSLTTCTGEDIVVAKGMEQEFKARLGEVEIGEGQLFSFIDWYIAEMKKVWE